MKITKAGGDQLALYLNREEKRILLDALNSQHFQCKCSVMEATARGDYHSITAHSERASKLKALIVRLEAGHGSR